MAASTIEDCDRLLDMINTMLPYRRQRPASRCPPVDEVDSRGSHPQSLRIVRPDCRRQEREPEL